MHDPNHDLHDELPEHREAIEALKNKNPHFSRMLEEYQHLNDKIYEIEEEHSPVSDDYLHDLKKRRLVIKDELFTMIQAI